MKVPSFMLKKLYVKNSLENTDDGFRFVLKNTLMDATIVKLVTLFIDNTMIPPESVTITAAGTSWLATDISGSNPAPMKVDVEVTIRVKGAPLKPGEHSLEIAAITREYNDIRFTVTDSV
ncbi:MAG: hypothetical protein HXS44_13450 [Theionarchaea archaeon]|nr:hypothetical protein [Theionarchaea archaeon]